MSSEGKLVCLLYCHFFLYCILTFIFTCYLAKHAEYIDSLAPVGFVLALMR